MLKINIEERINLRLSLLGQLYIHHFKAVGEPKMISKEDLKEKEVYLAYKYLAEKSYIEATPISGVGQSSSHRCKITVAGIDYIENNTQVFNN